jgi:hypothetical protein
MSREWVCPRFLEHARRQPAFFFKPEVVGKSVKVGEFGIKNRAKMLETSLLGRVRHFFRTLLFYKMNLLDSTPGNVYNTAECVEQNKLKLMGVSK